MGHHGQVLDFILLRRVLAEDFITLHCQSLTKKRDAYMSAKSRDWEKNGVLQPVFSLTFPPSVLTLIFPES